MFKELACRLPPSVDGALSSLDYTLRHLRTLGCLTPGLRSWAWERRFTSLGFILLTVKKRAVGPGQCSSNSSLGTYLSVAWSVEPWWGGSGPFTHQRRGSGARSLHAVGTLRDALEIGDAWAPGFQPNP